MIRIKINLCGMLLLCSYLAMSQDKKIQIGAELRPRFLVDNGYKSPRTTNDDTPAYTTQRTRLSALFCNNRMDAFVSVQDVRIWGDDNNYKSSGVYGNTESICLHQAWAKLKINEALSLKVGRQLLSYDDQRIISKRNWNDYQVTYDALLFEYQRGKQQLHLGISYNAEDKNNVEYPCKKFKLFDFVHYRYQVNKITLSGIAVVTGNTLNDTTSQVFYRGTYGMSANYTDNCFNARLSTYYQHNINDKGGDVSAYCISVYAEQKIVEQLSFGVGLDYLSGNDETSTSSANKRFDILYGRRHGWYGYMDFFSTTPQQGLQDYMVKLTCRPKKNLNLQLHWHYFRLATDKYDLANVTDKLNRNLGHEFDLKMKWKFHPLAVLECGYAVYSMTETLKQVKQVNGTDLKTPQFGYIMLTIKPSFWF
mgnify:CR=1 FL=1